MFIGWDKRTTAYILFATSKEEESLFRVFRKGDKLEYISDGEGENPWGKCPVIHLKSADGTRLTVYSKHPIELPDFYDFREACLLGDVTILGVADEKPGFVRLFIAPQSFYRNCGAVVTRPRSSLWRAVKEIGQYRI